VTTEDGKVNNFAHMLVDLHFMNLPEPMIPIGGHRVTEVEDPMGDMGLRLAGVYWSETQVPAAAVVVVGFDSPPPPECNSRWFDDQVRAAMGKNANRILGRPYDQVVFTVETDGDMIMSVMNDGVPGGVWKPRAAA